MKEYYIKKWTEKATILKKAYDIFKNDDIGIALENKLETVLIELADLLDSNECKEKIKFYGLSDEIINEIITKAQGMI